VPNSPHSQLDPEEEAEELRAARASASGSNWSWQSVWDGACGLQRMKAAAKPFPTRPPIAAPALLPTLHAASRPQGWAWAQGLQWLTRWATTRVSAARVLQLRWQQQYCAQPGQAEPLHWQAEAPCMSRRPRMCAAVLGLDVRRVATYSVDDIKSAYRQKAMEMHPDKVSGGAAQPAASSGWRLLRGDAALEGSGPS
jgi:hypothetical protein